MDPAIQGAIIGAAIAAAVALFTFYLNQKNIRTQRDREAVASFFRQTRNAECKWMCDKMQRKETPKNTMLFIFIQAEKDLFKKIASQKIEFYNNAMQAVEVLDLAIHNRSVRREIEKLERYLLKKREIFFNTVNLVLSESADHYGRSPGETDNRGFELDFYLASPISSKYQSLLHSIRNAARKELS